MLGTSRNRPGTGHQRPRSARFWAITVALASSLLAAATGDLDMTFGNAGIVTFDVGDSDNCGNDLLQQASGKLVFAGFGARAGTDSDFVATRYDSSGQRDDSFGTDGIAGADFHGGGDNARAILEQSDGQLVLVGAAGTTAESTRIGIARFSADGVPDASFGTDGLVELDPRSHQDFGRDVVQQADGKLVILVGIAVAGVPHMAVARVDAEGHLDTRFGADGFTVLDFGTDLSADPAALVQQEDGKLIAVGTVSNTFEYSDIGLARLTPEGQLDPTFDTDGLLLIDREAWDRATSVALQSDGRIIVGGSLLSDEGGDRAAMLRVGSDGTLDSDFGKGRAGIVTLSFTVEPDDSLLALAHSNDVMTARYSADGTLDETYAGGQGYSIVDFGEGSSTPFIVGSALLRQPDGRHVLLACDIREGGFAVARIDDAAASPGRIGLRFAERPANEEGLFVSVIYEVRRTGGTTGPASVDYATTSGTAVAGSDFTPQSGTLTWSDGDATDRTIEVPIINDSDVEAPEQFGLTLSNVSGAVLGASEATGTIENDDGPGEFSVFFGKEPIETVEGSFTRTALVLRTNGQDGAVTVDYASVDGSATTGADFPPLSGTLSWPDGESGPRSIDIELIDDDVVEGREDFEIRISNPTGGAVVRASEDVQLVSIAATDEGQSAGSLSLSSAAPAVAEGESVTLTVSRTGGAVGAVTVDYNASGGSAGSGTDYDVAQGTLSWSDGDTADKTITIATTDDSAQEADEDFDLALSNPDGGAVLGSPAARVVTITDNDSGGGGGDDDGDSGGGDGSGLALLAALALALRYRLMRSRKRPVVRHQTA